MTKLIIAALAAATLLLASPAYADSFTRVAGPDRYVTSVAVSRQIYTSICVPGTCPKAKAVVLASGQSQADALAATTLAHIADASTLLIQKDKIPADVWTEIQRILPKGKTIYILGGTAVINQAQQDFLKAQGYKVERLAGANRMATSVEIARKVDVLKATEPTKIYLVNGFAMADGVAVGALAALDKASVLTTEQGDLSQVIRDYINEKINSCCDVVIVGGTAVIPQSVEQLFKDFGFNVERIAGVNRYQTARRLSDRLISNYTPFNGAGLASGESLVDALTVGPLMAKLSDPLLLSTKNLSCTNSDKESLDFLAEYASFIKAGVMVGGTAVLPDSVKTKANQAISGALPQC